MTCKTKQGVFVPNLKLFGQTKTELQTKKVVKIFHLVLWENGLVGFFCLPSWLLLYRCMEMFPTLNSCNFCIDWYINLKLAETFQSGVICIVETSKMWLIKIFDDVIANQEYMY